MTEPIERCEHASDEVFEGRCDCGRIVLACADCLAADLVLSCGQCGIAEATVIADGSLALARQQAKLEKRVAELGGDVQDKEILLRFLAAQDNEGEEWKQES